MFSLFLCYNFFLPLIDGLHYVILYICGRYGQFILVLIIYQSNYIINHQYSSIEKLGAIISSVIILPADIGTYCPEGVSRGVQEDIEAAAWQAHRPRS